MRSMLNLSAGPRFVRSFLSAAAVAGTCMCAAGAHAAPYAWTGSAGDNKWESPNNWSPTGVPGLNDDATIGAGASAVTISNGNVTVKSLNLGRNLNIGTTRTFSVTTAAVAGTITLADQSALSGGTYTINAGGNFVFAGACAYSRITNLTINGTLPAVSGAAKWNNITLNGAMIASAGNCDIAFEGSQTLNGTLQATSGLMRLGGTGTGTLTITPTGKIQGGNVEIYNKATCLGVAGQVFSIVNNGTIEAATAGMTVNLNVNGGVDLVNHGTLKCGPGNLTLAGFNGTGGAVTLLGGTMNFTGAFNPSTLGAYSRTAGTAKISTTVDLAGSTWSPSGPWTLADASAVQNGTIDFSTGSLLFPNPCGFARLSNITLNGSMPTFAGGLRWNNVTLNGTLTCAGGGGATEIVFEGSQTLSGTIVATAATTLRMSSTASGTLTIPPSAKIMGGSIEFYNRATCLVGTPVAYTVVNNGTIDANLAGTTINFSTSDPVGFTNNALLKCGPGNLTLTGVNGAAGSLALSGGTLTLGGTCNPAKLGTFTRTGGTSQITGIADLASGTWNVLGTWTLSPGATVQNGTANLAVGTIAFPGLCGTARLSNMTLNGSLPAFTGGMRWNNVTLNGTITSAGPGPTEIIFEGSQTLAGTIAATGNTTLRLSGSAAGTLTIAPTGKIQGGEIELYTRPGCGGGPFAFNVVNNGTIDANVAGKSINFNTSDSVALVNNGTVKSGPGTLTLFTTINNGTMKPGAGSTMRISSAATILGSGGILEIDVKGPPPAAANSGALTLTNSAASTVALGGTLKVNYVNGYVPTCGLAWNVVASALVAAGTPITGVFAAINAPNNGDGNAGTALYAAKAATFLTASAADFDHDGFLTFEDFDSFVSAFEAGDAAADFNADGFLTFEDFDAFVAKFEGGC